METRARGSAPPAAVPPRRVRHQPAPGRSRTPTAPSPPRSPSRPPGPVFNGSPRARADLGAGDGGRASPDGPTVAFVTLDAIGAGNVIQERLTDAVSSGHRHRPRPTSLFGQTHTHAGPDLQGLWGGVPQEWIERTLYPGRGDGRARRPAGQRAGSTRRPQRRAGRRTTATGGRGGSTPRCSPTARPRSCRPGRSTTARSSASLLQYAAHPTSVDEDVRIPHPDYILGAVDWIERESGGVALYFNGPIADASAAGGRAGCDAGTRRRPTARSAAGARASPKARWPSRRAPRLSSRRSRSGTSPSRCRSRTRCSSAAGVGEAFNRYYDFLDLPVDEIPGIGPALERRASSTCRS